uniref:Uncharacterized protein n=1 Tax=Moniliophthora roreri TaxID=221103 RepID=A0A0W0FXQ1_MONRR
MPVLWPKASLLLVKFSTFLLTVNQIISLC